MREKMAGDVVAGDVEKEKVVQAGEEVGGEKGEGVVLDEELLQATFNPDSMESIL